MVHMSKHSVGVSLQGVKLHMSFYSKSETTKMFRVL